MTELSSLRGSIVYVLDHSSTYCNSIHIICFISYSLSRCDSDSGPLSTKLKEFGHCTRIPTANQGSLISS